MRNGKNVNFIVFYGLYAILMGVSVSYRGLIFFLGLSNTYSGTEGMSNVHYVFYSPRTKLLSFHFSKYLVRKL